MPTPTERAAQIERLRQLPDELERRVRDLTPEQLTALPLAGEWSVAQNIHHLADSHMNAFIRAKLLLTEEHPTIKPYDQDAWASRPDANHADIDMSLQLLRGLHQRFVKLFEGVSEVEWERAGLHPENGVFSVADQLRLYAAHGEAHLEQIDRTLAALAL
ncbi:MAG: DinB family protein [Chloroflexaceae bacterium]|jgi:hypothetical protein|nr:DinB family protein [Chloroflexaceae bacterium]